MNRPLSTLILSSASAVALMAGPAEAKMPAFTGSCPTNITVKSDGLGTVRLNGKKAKVTKSNENYYEARRNGVTISIAMDASGLIVSYTAKGGANGICTVTAKSGDAGGSDVPSKDEQACLQAVSQKTNNGDVVTLSTNTSEANNTVMVGVGPQRAPWKCLVKNGKVAGVSSATDEGAL
jgi:hypothetical protein